MTRFRGEYAPDRSAIHARVRAEPDRWLALGQPWRDEFPEAIAR